MASDMATMMAELDEYMKNTKVGDDIKYPIEVSAIRICGRPPRTDEKVGSWVAIRPCADELKDRTFLGVYLGDMRSIWHSETYNLKTRQVDVILTTNPAIYVPDLKQVIWGYESWWGVIDSPDKMRMISNKDIQNAWYVRALKELEEAKTST